MLFNYVDKKTAEPIKRLNNQFKTPKGLMTFTHLHYMILNISKFFLTFDILTCQSRKRTDAIDNGNDGMNDEVRDPGYNA